MNTFSTSLLVAKHSHFDMIIKTKKCRKYKGAEVNYLKGKRNISGNYLTVEITKHLAKIIIFDNIS